MIRDFSLRPGRACYVKQEAPRYGHDDRPGIRLGTMATGARCSMSDSEMQKAAGLTNPRVYHSADSKSEIVVVFDTKDTKALRHLLLRTTSKRQWARLGWHTYSPSNSID